MFQVGYTAPPIEVAAPALLFTSAKDGGLADAQDGPSPYDAYTPFQQASPYAPSPYAQQYYAPPPPRPQLRPQPARGSRLFRPSPIDPTVPVTAPASASTTAVRPSTAETQRPAARVGQP